MENERNSILATAVEQAAESVMITDKSGIIQYANPAFEKISGFTRDEIIGKKPSILKSGRQSAAFYKTMWETISRGEVWKGLLVNRRKDGALYEVEISISPIRDESGAITNYVSVKRDVTEERRLEQQLVRAQKMEAIGTLASGIAHDFNNIVTAILGFTDLVIDDIPEGTKTRRRLGYVREAGLRARDLIKQILSFSRQNDTGRKPVKLAPIVKETLKLIKASIPATIEIRQSISSDGRSVLADPVQIQQILMNLCTNAAHAMREHGGVLEVSLTALEFESASYFPQPGMAPGPYFRMTVADTGCGMDSSMLERIFDPFFTTKKPEEGTGLGLAVVQRIVKSYGGAITVTSEPGKGSSFEVFLPCITAGEKGGETVAPSVEKGSGTILFVDDDPSIIRLGRDLLRQLGYRVVTSRGAREALNTFEKNPHRFSLLLTDYIMPHMTGTELAREAHKIRPDIPIAMITGLTQIPTKGEMKSAGVLEVALKPLTMEELAEIIKRAMSRT
ncbi:MAG: Blue-light-activated protein [Syntrophorhabdaceae bacterium PtaU1.Bin034]|nr:MAG: Blue-light-activated protein [Syntrophorhabdaceae bacterium PtaU1.Bin034]